MTLTVDVAGLSINDLLVIKKIGSNKGKVIWECKCRCGIFFNAVGTSIRLGKVKSCKSCAKNQRIKNATKHGMVGSSEYITYNAMKSRCYNANDKRYKRYGARGIVVCDRWLNSFQNFIDDMGIKPTSKHSIERIDIDKNYEPSNCIWASPEQQANNKSNNNKIEINGQIKNIGEWANETGINRTVILRRLKRGFSGEDLIKKGILK